jgi:hypothetical protein
MKGFYNLKVLFGENEAESAYLVNDLKLGDKLNVLNLRKAFHF